MALVGTAFHSILHMTIVNRNIEIDYSDDLTILPVSYLSESLGHIESLVVRLFFW